ncbi:cyclopropane-fatty-acyl-phospholipid synthase family protein [Gordonia sp. HY285]|uniref:SAM-dependent methyltransferase n=1 Tax=Gordonia liuliyuniae TaxID=2911517 RepID=UPI001F43A3F3|nr:cyclopropane-fatty-acyl-phospholipid synthase family protein [Gordonia liuliyuniae]MCF8612089.1 cyclopropane-fatty-acyl-phospholipid synthase family protein [Gordonia liuliyuniae]
MTIDRLYENDIAQSRDLDDRGSAVDPARWPDVAARPESVTARIRGRAAEALFRRATAGLPPDAPRMIVHDEDALFRRVGTAGLIGFGESYMAGEWTADDLVATLTPLAQRIADIVPAALQRLRPIILPSHPRDEENSLANTRSNISRHYDLSNDLFASFLDETMTYSSAYFGSDDAAAHADWDDLADAQRAKIDRLLDQAGVESGTRLLEIGTGWGELAVRAAERGAVVRSITLSHEQQAAARRRATSAGLADRIRVDLADYRSVDGDYDAVVSVEMVEAVGRDYWGDYFATINRVLAPGGRAAIQAITMPHDRVLASTGTYTWVHKYIFPGGQIPSEQALRHAAALSGLTPTYAESFGLHYAKTLELWRERFSAHRDRVAELGFDDTFVRMWTFYLAYSEAGFASRYLDVCHLVYTKGAGR